MEAGLIFVSTNDLFGQVVCSITKELYNHVGFYLTSNSTGSWLTKIFLFDTFRCGRPSWLPVDATIEHLCSNPLVNKVVKKKLRGDHSQIENFKLGIATALSEHITFELVPAIYKLFGHHCDPICIENKTDIWCGQSAIDLINNTFKKIGIWDKLRNVEGRNHEIETGNFYNSIARLFTTLPSVNLTLDTLISDKIYFEEQKEVSLDQYEKYGDSIEKYDTENFHQLIELLKVAMDQFEKNAEFRDTIRKCVELTERNKSVKVKRVFENLESDLINIKDTEKITENIKKFLQKMKIINY